MSSSDPTTASDLVQLFTTVEAQEAIRDRICGTEPELFEYTGSVAHWLYFSTESMLFGTGLDYVCVGGSSADFLAGTLPEKIYIDPVELDYVATSAHVLASSHQPNNTFLKLPREEIKKYQQANYLIMRVDGDNENNREILFVSTGSLTTMFSDVFEREMTAFVTSSDYDPSAGTNAESGWYIGMCSEVDLITDVYFTQELCTNSSVDLIAATTTGLIVTNTAPPLINWSTEPEKIHTFEDGSTAPTTLLIDFGSYPAIQYKGDQADSVIVYKEDSQNSIVLGAGQTPMLDEPQKTTCNLTGLYVEMAWDIIII